MKVYHGTIDICSENIIYNGINLKKGKPRVDFGQGFYTTPDYKFAKNTATNKCYKTNSYKGKQYCKACVLTYELDEKLVKNNNLKILEFKKRDINWAQFIINNRNGINYVNNVGTGIHNINGTYDIVKGAIADNSIVTIAKQLQLLNDSISQVEVNNILYNYKTMQISFHTKNSLKCIKLLNCDIIK